MPIKNKELADSLAKESASICMRIFDLQNKVNSVNLKHDVTGKVLNVRKMINGLMKATEKEEGK